MMSKRPEANSIVYTLLFVVLGVVLIAIIIIGLNSYRKADSSKQSSDTDVTESITTDSESNQDNQNQDDLQSPDDQTLPTDVNQPTEPILPPIELPTSTQ